MTRTDIVRRINEKMNFASWSYDELREGLDAAIDYLNLNWRVNIEPITNSPEMEVSAFNKQSVSTNYTALTDEFIRMFVVPFVAGYKYTRTGRDGTPESMEAATNLSRLPERYPNIKPGAETITKDDVNYEILQEDTSDQFADGRDNFGSMQENSSDYSGDWGGI